MQLIKAWWAKHQKRQALLANLANLTDHGFLDRVVRSSK